jgi:drug/metabolite transporter (DMT)-like permease
VPDVRALSAALVTVTLWASAFAGIRSAGHHLSPGALALGRLAVASVVLTAFALVRRSPLPKRRDLVPIAVAGLLWLGVYNVVLNEAERRVDAGTAAMLVNTGPLFIALLAGLVLREGFPSSLFLGCAVAFGGSALIAGATAQTSADAGWGAVLCVVAALTWAGGVVTQKPVLARVSGLHVIWLGCLVATIACLPFAPALVRELRTAGASPIAWTAYLGAFPTAVGFVTWAYALKRTTAGRMGSTTYLVPPIAVLLAWAFLGETPPWLALVGGALCLTGVVLARPGVRARALLRRRVSAL